MDSELFRRINERRAQFKTQHIKSLRNKANEVREHELAHARAAGKHVKSVEFRYTRDANNIEHLSHGIVHVDISTSANVDATIEKFKTLIKAAQAVDNPSAQDRRLQNYLTAGLSNLQRSRK